MNQQATAPEAEPRELTVERVEDLSALAAMSRQEFDVQIATAKKYPRSLTRFTEQAVAMVTSSLEFAGMCIYCIPRDNKMIEGPSARFAEVLLNRWSNSRAAARVIEEGDEFVTTQGVFYDLEQNVAINYECKRRIIDRNGHRYSADMIAVTANAACSIAIRNAVLKGIPKSFWLPIYEAARHLLVNQQDVPKRRQMALSFFEERFKLKAEDVLRLLGLKRVEEIEGEELARLRGIATAVEDGDISLEELRSGRPIQMPKAKAAKPEKAPSKKEQKAAAKRAAAEEKKAANTPPAEPPSTTPVKAAIPISEKQRIAFFDKAVERLPGSAPGDAVTGLVRRVIQRFGFTYAGDVTQDRYDEVMKALCDEPLELPNS